MVADPVATTVKLAGELVETVRFCGWLVMTTCGITTRLICPGVLSLMDTEPLTVPPTMATVGLNTPVRVPVYVISVLVDGCRGVPETLIARMLLVWIIRLPWTASRLLGPPLATWKKFVEPFSKTR